MPPRQAILVAFRMERDGKISVAPRTPHGPSARLAIALNTPNFFLTVAASANAKFLVDFPSPRQGDDFYTRSLLTNTINMPSFWDVMTGRKPSQPKSSDQSLSSQSPSTSPSSGATRTSYPEFDPTDGQGTDAFLKPSTFADPSALYPLAGINQETLEYLTLDDTALAEGHTVMPSRGFFDDLCYGTGVTYITALGIGGAWGLQEGLRKSVGQPPKLRLNSVLNAVTRRGPFLGNSCGVIALSYNFVNAYIGYLRGKDDAANAIAAGFLTGMAFKSTRGMKPMLISGGIVGSVAALWAVSFYISGSDELGATLLAYRNDSRRKNLEPEADSCILGWEASLFTTAARKRSEARVKLRLVIILRVGRALGGHMYSQMTMVLVISAPVDSCKLEGSIDRMHGLDMALRIKSFHALTRKVIKIIFNSV